MYDYDQLKPSLRNGVQLYLEEGVRPGHFLCAIIDNDLKEAVYRADHENVQIIPQVVFWFRDNAPMNAWGSREERLTWETVGGLKGRGEAIEPNP